MFLIFFCIFIAWSAQETGAECPPLIGRNEWDAVKPLNRTFLSSPIDLVIILHTVTETCSNDQSCAEVVRGLQKTHIEESFLWDIAPSFLVGGTGKLYVGRGWQHVAIHTAGFNNQSIGIAFIGNFNNQDPSPKALDAVKALIQCGVDTERLTKNHKVLVHSQLLSTESPGKKLAAKIMSWPDWVNDVSEIRQKADDQEYRMQSRAGKELVLKTPKEIDLFTNMRDVIAKLIDNMSKLAHGTVDTIADLTRGMNTQVSLFTETLASALKKLRDLVEAAFSGTSGILKPQKGPGSCNVLKERANSIYDTTETRAKDCANSRVKEIDDMIKILGTLSANAIDYTNTAVEKTKNCTELNIGIETPTKNCLNSVTQDTKSASKTYEGQRTTSLNSIKTQLQALPAALDLCAKQHLPMASEETTKIVSDISKCYASSVIPEGLNVFGKK